MGKARILCTYEILQSVLWLPETAKVERVYVDEQHPQSFMMVVSSPEFRETAKHEPLPAAEMLFEWRTHLGFDRWIGPAVVEES